MNDLKIDPEFRDLIPPLSDEDFKQLEENILHDGIIQNPLNVWQGILIDGHHRYEIAQAHGLEFKTVEMHFADRDEAKIWIGKHQLGTRTMTPAMRVKIAMTIEPIIAAKAKEHSLANLKQNTDSDKCRSRKKEQLTLQEKRKNERQNATNYQVAQMAQVSDKTVERYKKIQEKASDDIKAKVDSGEISINAAYEGVKAGATTVEEIIEVKKQKVAFNTGNNERYTPADIIEDARKVLGTIDLDPASSELANETVKASKIYTAEDDGLAHEWAGNIWLNPPYSKDLLALFAEKLVSSTFNQAIVLVINSTETKWFSKLISKASAIVFPTGRVICPSPVGNDSSPLQGSAIIYFGNNPQMFLDVFEPRGWGACL